MPFFRSKTSAPAQTSLIYLTIGCLMIVWTGVWYIYLLNHPAGSAGIYYLVAGFALTGITLVAIGLAVGQIGRAARHAQAADVIAPEVPVAANQTLAPAATVPPSVQPVSAAPVATNANTIATNGSNRQPAINVPR
jgi:hypothetical protein